LSKTKPLEFISYGISFSNLRENARYPVWYSETFAPNISFYGGTALRILFGMDRFSEDLDFSLLTRATDFALSRYSAAVERELRSLGFEARRH
jgi:predicted nucleotidyltransferase component of viral defense system